MTKKYRIKSGNIFAVLPISGALLRGLEKIGMNRAHAAFWIYRQAIILGGDQAKYEPQRSLLAKLIEEGGEAV